MLPTLKGEVEIPVRSNKVRPFALVKWLTKKGVEKPLQMNTVGSRLYSLRTWISNHIKMYIRPG